MSKFKIRLKLQGLELDIEGVRDDMPVISRSLGQQFTGLFKPMESIIDGELVNDAPPSPANKSQPYITIPPKPKRRKPASSSSDSSERTSGIISFKHDPAKYGMPRQQWNPTLKSLWLLYVAKEQADEGELPAGAIAKTFNQHFKQAGLLRGSNVGRDLGKAKLTTPALVGEDTTKRPPLWFLTDEGRSRAQGLVAEALAPSS